MRKLPGSSFFIGRMVPFNEGQSPNDCTFIFECNYLKSMMSSDDFVPLRSVPAGVPGLGYLSVFLSKSTFYECFDGLYEKWNLISPLTARIYSSKRDTFGRG